MSNQSQFTKSNLRGSYVLFAIVILVFILPDLIRYCSTTEIISFKDLPSEDQKAITELKKREKQHFTFRTEESRYLPPPEKFNPDEYTVEQWMALGLSEKQAKVVAKWHIHSNEDLKKVFVIDDELYALIKDSTFYSEQPKQLAFQEKPRLAKRVDLNAASEEELMEIKGVGSYFAKQIIRKREWLGGFYSFEQLKEIKFVDDEKLSAWKTQAYLGDNALRKINVNTATAEELKAHPYISWNLANSLVKLRSQIGKYSSVEDTKKSVLMTADLYEKLKNYFVVE